MTLALASPLTVETGWVEDIPTLAVLPAPAHAVPVVFYIPGYGMPKETGLALAYQLARRGLACVSFDPLYHGERRDPRVDHAADPAFGGVYPPETGLDIASVFYQVIHHCVHDIRALLTHYASDARFDTTRAGVTGHSMGAYASFLACADIPAIHAAVPMMGLPTFTQRWRDILDETAFSNAEWAAALAPLQAETARRSAFIEQIDPAERLKAAPRAALLVMNGDFDSDQPKLYVLGWMREMRRVYAACLDRLQWNVYPVGHVQTPQMEADAVDWFARHLAA